MSRPPSMAAGATVSVMGPTHPAHASYPASSAGRVSSSSKFRSRTCSNVNVCEDRHVTWGISIHDMCSSRHDGVLHLSLIDQWWP